MNGVSAAVPKRSDFELDDCRFQLIVEASPCAMIVVDGSQRILLVNRGAEALFGYSHEELADVDIDALIPARFRLSSAKQVSEFFRDPRSRSISTAGDLVGRRKDGSEVPIEIGLHPIETASGHYILPSILDVTERRYHEEALRLGS
jgi:PAS domain S-box-containing protein